MIIFGKIILSLLSYAFIMNLILVLVKCDKKNPIAQYMGWSTALSWLFGGILSIFWVLIKIWS